MASSSRVASVGIIGAGRMAETVAKAVLQKIQPELRFCYKRQKLVNNLVAADSRVEKRQFYDGLGFSTTTQPRQVVADCEVVMITTSAQDVLQRLGGTRARSANQQHQDQQQKEQPVLFVNFCVERSIEEMEKMIGPNAKVVHMLSHTFLKQKGLELQLADAAAVAQTQALGAPPSWVTVRGSRASTKDIEKVMDLFGKSVCIEVDLEKLRKSQTKGTLKALAHDVSGVDVHSDFSAQEAAAAAALEPKKNVRFADEFTLGPLLGKGHFAQVFLATHNVTGTAYAVKCIPHGKVTAQATESLRTEVSALQRLKHPNIIQNYGFFDEDGKYYLVLDYCAKGSLRSLLAKKPSHRLSEKDTKHIIRSVLSALEYCHLMGQVHRDVKADNILVREKNEEGYCVKLADFGLSSELNVEGERLFDLCGTPQYLAPEMVKRQAYGMPCDIWSVGILTYMMLTGVAPFEEAVSERHLFKMIRLGAIRYDLPVWNELSPLAKDFVMKMLEICPESRATAKQLLRHPYLTASSA